jgi:hypothetical protein
MLSALRIVANREIGEWRNTNRKQRAEKKENTER